MFGDDRTYVSLLLPLEVQTNRRLTDAEALRITSDPSVVSYRQLLEYFYRMHDPTTANRQGPDVGTQYRSVIFTEGDEQARIAKDVTAKVAAQWYKGKPITTQIVPLGKWWDAEEYHQLYLEKNPFGYECPSQYAHPFLSLLLRMADLTTTTGSFVRQFPPLSE